jgi:hypothetical protein
MRRLGVGLLLLSATLLSIPSCGQSTRAESRQARLDTFRQTLPADVRGAFDSITTEQGYGDVGRLMTAAREHDALFDARLDSIMHAELIDCFSDSEVVRFFRVYFADALRDGTVPEP